MDIYLLAGRLRCGLCGERMYSTAKTSRGYTYLYYRCAAAVGHLVGKTCDARSFRADRIDPVAWAEIHATIEDPEIMRNLVSEVVGEEATDNDLLERQVSGVRARREEKEAQRRRLLALYLEGRYGREDLDALHDDLTAEIAQLEEREAELKERLAERDTDLEALHELEQLAAGLRDELARAGDDFQTRRTIVEAFVCDSHGLFVVCGRHTEAGRGIHLFSVDCPHKLFLLFCKTYGIDVCARTCEWGAGACRAAEATSPGS